MSHEKDPETMLWAVALMRARGRDAVVLNLGGGFREFLDLAQRNHGADALQWTMGRPAVHPMDGLADYYRACDVVVQASLEEGLGYSPLEALACGTPVVATAVGGLNEALPGFAQLTPRLDPVAMADALMAVAADPASALEQALAGRDHVAREYSSTKAFADLERALREVAQENARGRVAAELTA
jgi:glycosyltransferase involved in cell wall biosynthesis